MAKSSKGAQEKKGPATISNRRATYEYEVIDTYEAGLALAGAEVKSLFLGRASLSDAYCRIVNGELWLFNADIEPYSHSSIYTPDRRRDRKLLLHRREIAVLMRKAQEKGLAIIPLKIYFSKRWAKVSIATARGKKTFDKRETLKEKEQKRELDRTLKGD
jgi:SsrA-binding protein